MQLAEALHAYGGNAADYRGNLWLVLSSTLVPIAFCYRYKDYNPNIAEFTFTAQHDAHFHVSTSYPGREFIMTGLSAKNILCSKHRRVRRHMGEVRR